MIVSLVVAIRIPWAHSLKEKRMEVRSLLQRTRNKFNVSAAEVAEQDTHQTIVLGIAAVVASTAQADSTAESIVHFLQSSTEGELTDITKEIL